MEIQFKHHVEYLTQSDVPISVVAKSLLANERFIHEGLQLFGDIFEDLEISSVSVRVSELNNASRLKEILAGVLFLTYQKDLDKEIPEIIEKLTGLEVPTNMDTLVTVLVMITAVYVISKAVDRLFPGKEAKELKEEYLIKLGELAILTNIAEDDIHQYVEKRYKDKTSKTLVQKASDLFQPTKLEPDVGIFLPNGKDISANAMSEIPSEIDYEMLERRKTFELTDTLVDIHRADRDYNKQGWVAVVEVVSDKRVKMELSPELSPASLYGETKLRGDITVVEELADTGEYGVKMYFLTKLHKE